MQRFLVLLVSILVLVSCEVFAQALSPTPPQDQSVTAWREAWYAYGREVRAFCATHYPQTVGTCLEREMRKQGVSPAFFTELYTATPQWTPGRSWCTAANLRRCDGTTVQTCNVQTSLWEDYQRCETIGQRCSTREAECTGLVNWACCTR